MKTRPPSVVDAANCSSASSTPCLVACASRNTVMRWSAMPIALAIARALAMSTATPGSGGISGTE